MDIWLTLTKAVDLYPEKVGVIDGKQALTYSHIGERVCGLARFFQQQGMQPKDRMSVLEVNSHAFLETYYAAAGIGAILNPLNYRLSPQEVAFILRDSGARWLVAGAQFAPLVAGILKEETTLEGILWIGGSPSETTNIPDDDYERIRTVGDAVRYIEQRLRGGP